MKRYSTLLVDDHILILDGLKAALDKSEFEVVAQAHSLAHARALVHHYKPEVVILDFHLPDGLGIDLIAPRSVTVSTIFIVLTMSEDASELELARQAGASAFIIKSSPVSELMNVARYALKNPAEFQSPLGITRSPEPQYFLTEREQQVLKILPSGLTVKEIASLMFISQATIKSHLANIYRKLSVANRTQAIDKALKEKLISL